MSKNVDDLINGYRNYRDGAYEDSRALIDDLVTRGQRPEVALVACSDSRVDPAILFQSDPGDLFMIRNVANLVPPMERDSSYHGISAALEFAVLGLGVKNLIVLGHAHCGGVRHMMDPTANPTRFEYVTRWVSMLKPAHERVREILGEASEAEYIRACEQQSVVVSLENLMTFPWVSERVESGDLQLHGWYVDIAGPELSAYDSESGDFQAFE